jgi:hypothetical protein
MRAKSFLLESCAQDASLVVAARLKAKQMLISHYQTRCMIARYAHAAAMRTSSNNVLVCQREEQEAKTASDLLDRAWRLKPSSYHPTCPTSPTKK